MLRVRELAHRVDVGTAAEAAVGDHRLDALEITEDLLARRRVRRRHDVPRQARSQVGGDQVVLGGVVLVERPLADVGRGGDGVDADGADPLAVEQPVGGRQDPFAW